MKKDNAFVYRGIRVEPNYNSGMTNRTLANQKGWCICFPPGVLGLISHRWYSVRIADARAYIDHLNDGEGVRLDVRIVMAQKEGTAESFRRGSALILQQQEQKKQEQLAREVTTVKEFAKVRLLQNAPELLDALEWALSQIEYDLCADKDALTAADALVRKVKGV